MKRTIQLRLKTDEETARALAETTGLFTRAFNVVCRVGWDAGVRNSVKLHRLTYLQAKGECPGLVSDLLIQARVKASETLRSAFTRKRKGRKVSCPRSASCPPRFNHHTATVNWEKGTVRLSTAQGRITLAFTLPAYFQPYTSGRTRTADLIFREGKWFLHVSVEIPEPARVNETQVVGVDLGLCRPVVLSNNRFLGKRQWRQVEDRYFRLRRSLQSKGTRSARRHLRRMAKRENRFRKDCDHVLTREIMRSVGPGTVIALEDLTHIRSRLRQRGSRGRRRLHRWSFARLRAFLAYKAEGAGVRVVAVDPRHTSQRCSRCGHTEKANRRSQSDFQCRRCGFRLNADLNGARNVAWKHLAGRAMSLPGGLMSTSLMSADPGGQAVGFTRR